MRNGFILRNRVRELRARLHLRQSDLAREVDVTRQTILAIEKGRLNPSILVSLKIARVLREPVGYVFYLDRPAPGEVLEMDYAGADLEPAVEEPVLEPHAVCDFL